MTASHKNKTFAALLALLFGGAGLHRFYLHGLRDRWGWLHAAALLLSGGLLAQDPSRALLVNTAPLVLSVLAACIETFVIGLMADEKWDAHYNATSGQQSDTSWMVAVLMVVNLGYGATLMLIALARSFDLLLTGGSYG
jgi:hypothetical protein